MENLSPPFWLSTLITTGTAGYINYSILLKLRFLNFGPNQQKDKNITITMCSLINYSIYLLINAKITDNKTPISILLTLIFSSVLSVTIYPLVIYLFDIATQRINRKMGYATISNKDVRDKVFDNGVTQYVVIFTFDNQLIVDGYLENYSSNHHEYNELLIVPPDSNHSIVFDDFISTFRENKSAKILVDFEKSIKIYVIDIISVSDQKD